MQFKKFFCVLQIYMVDLLLTVAVFNSTVERECSGK